MANTIKLKTGSGSDPSASDLVLGELAIRTDNGKIFLKKDNGSVAEVSGGGIDDGDKGDITVSNSGDTFTIDSGVVTSAKIADGTIVNADINSSAAIAGSKISPTFTSDLTVEHSGHPTILIHDTSGDNQCKLQFQTDSYSWVAGLHGGENRWKVSNSSAFGTNDYLEIDTSGNLYVGNNITANNITVSGTVDGRDVATDGSKLDGIESGATADQTASEILTLIKTVDGSGSGLDADTLDGISSASFVRSDASDTLTGATYTLSSTTDQKIILSGSSNPYIRFQEGTTEKGFIQWNSSGYLRLQNQEDGSILDVRDSIRFSSDSGSSFNNVFHEGNLTVGDGGLTQNNFTNTLKSKLDGIAASATNVTNNNQLTNGAGYITATLTNEQVQDIVGGMVSGNTESGITVTYQDGDGTLDFVVGTLNQNTTGNAATATKLATARTIAGVSFDGSANISLNNNAITNGAGYITSADGGNAATLDSLDSTAFLRSNAADSATGDITFSGGAGAATIGGNSDIRFSSGSWTGEATKIQHHSNWLYLQGGSNGFIFRHSDGTNRWNIDSQGTFRPNTDGAVDIGTTSSRVGEGHFLDLASRHLKADNGIVQTKQTIAFSYSLTANYNAMSVDPTVNSGVTVTVPSGAVWAIV